MAFIQAYVQEVLPDPSMYEGILTAKAVQDDPSAEKPPENMLLSKAITNVVCMIGFFLPFCKK